MSASARATFAERAPAAISALGPLAAILFAGLVLRLLFIGGSGFHNDIQAFEAWALTLTEHPLDQFYASTSFADYPPGYFFVLFVVGWFYKALVAAHAIAPGAYGVLGMLVKLPAIVMDLVDAALLYAIVRRFAPQAAAFGAACLLAFNPAAIYVSAYWGQVDSVSWGLVLAAMLLILRSGDAGARRKLALIAAAWFLLSASVLMKPQATFVGFVFLAYAFASASAHERAERLKGTALGFAGGVVLAYAAAAIFHGSFDPVGDFAWLYQRYAYASTVYPYNTINAFNLYALKQAFWQPDGQPITIAGVAIGPMVAWGWALVLGATALVVARYLQRRDDRAFLEAAMLVSFGFFILATRMHERYVFGAFLLMMPLAAFGRRYLWSAAALSVTLLANLAYSLQYQTVMEAKTPGADPTNLWPLVSHPLAAVNVALFFLLGYLYLGGSIGSLGAVGAGALVRVRAWFDPREGIVRMRPRDWALAIGMVVASFALCIVAYQWPAEKVFDEIYYARAGEEYLKNVEIFEFTHPPLTKLIIAFSMLLVGGGNGLSGVADSGFGWRLLNIVIGALTVGVMYAFAKRITGSTLFAAVAGGMLLFDGFHFVQSRIATPEITVAFFSLTTLYAFYRLWIAAQVASRPSFGRASWTALGVTMAVGTIAAAAIAWSLADIGTGTSGAEFLAMTRFVIFVWLEGLVYLLARLVVPRLVRTRGTVTSYAEGTRVVAEPGGRTVTTPEGATIAAPARAFRTGAPAPVDADDARRSYGKDGSLAYATPAGTAEFQPAGTMRVGEVTIAAADARLWLVVLAISGAALAASKWNGLFDFFVVWGLSAIVTAQRWLRRPAVYGNPFGFSLDVVVALMFVVGGALYALCYIPYFRLGHNLVDMVSLQKQMYWYHSTLKATHPYQSQWWQWPILQRPISYYYHDFRTGADAANGAACCVSEILALPNPFVWWLGLASVPFVAALAWIERNKAYALLVAAYILQWLPWIGSPRIAFEYHFYPNLAVIVLANAILLQRLWKWGVKDNEFTLARASVLAYLGIVVVAFVYFYPVLAGLHIPYNTWHDRMWFTSWI